MSSRIPKTKGNKGVFIIDKNGKWELNELNYKLAHNYTNPVVFLFNHLDGDADYSSSTDIELNNSFDFFERVEIALSVLFKKTIKIEFSKFIKIGKYE